MITDKQGLSYISNFNLIQEGKTAVKKFILKLVMALIPFILYAVLFVSFEPYNYWGIKPLKTGRWATPLARVREFMREPSEYLILGDSRMNLFDLDYVEELTGHRYANLSTGGEELNLTLELYEWALEHVEPKKVVVDASFWQMDEGKSPSAKAVFYMADHPLQYIVTRDYVIETFEALMETFKEPVIDKVKLVETDRQEFETDTKYREDLLEYTLGAILPLSRGYIYSEESLGYLRVIAEDINSRGGEIVFVAPPVQECVWDYVIEPCNIREQMDDYKKILLGYGTVYDFEWKSEFVKNQDYYDDGFHFNGSVPYRLFTEAIFTGVSDFMHVLQSEN